jgi:hypothetical protein
MLDTYHPLSRILLRVMGEEAVHIRACKFFSRIGPRASHIAALISRPRV